MALGECGVVRLSLFDAGEEKRSPAQVTVALDALNARYGRDTVHMGFAAVVNRWAASFEISVLLCQTKPDVQYKQSVIHLLI